MRHKRHVFSRLNLWFCAWSSQIVIVSIIFIPDSRSIRTGNIGSYSHLLLLRLKYSHSSDLKVRHMTFQCRKWVKHICRRCRVLLVLCFMIPCLNCRKQKITINIVLYINHKMCFNQRPNRYRHSFKSNRILTKNMCDIGWYNTFGLMLTIVADMVDTIYRYRASWQLHRWLHMGIIHFLLK